MSATPESPRPLSTVSQPAASPPASLAASLAASPAASPAPSPAPAPLYRARSAETYYEHPNRSKYEQRLAAALAHLHTHEHWRDVVTAIGLLHRGVDIAAESYGPNTRGPAGDVLMRLRAAVPRQRWHSTAPSSPPAVWIMAAGHCLLVVCLIAVVIAMAAQK